MSKLSALCYFTYFNEQVWRSCGGDLFSGLQRQAEIFMDEIADLCDQRHTEMCADSQGTELMALPSWPPAERDISPNGSLDHHSPKNMAAFAHLTQLALPTRQDHDEVQLLFYIYQ